MNFEKRISKIEAFLQPQKSIDVKYTNIERAMRIFHLMDRVNKGKPIGVSDKTASRIFDLLDAAMARKKATV